MQFLIISRYLHKFVVSATFNDSTFMQNAYFVRVLDGREAVGYGNGCASLHEFVERILYKAFTFGV